MMRKLYTLLTLCVQVVLGQSYDLMNWPQKIAGAIPFRAGPGLAGEAADLLWNNTAKTLRIGAADSRPASLTIVRTETGVTPGTTYGGQFSTLEVVTTVDAVDAYYRASSHGLWLEPAVATSISDIDHSRAAALAGGLIKHGAGTADGGSSFMSSAEIHDTGNVGDWRSFLARTPTRPDGSGAFTNFYGLYIEDLKTAFVTNAYGVYQVGSTLTNYFAGSLDAASFKAGGTPGITETCTVIPTGITIKAGIITAIVGGTCLP